MGFPAGTRARRAALIAVALVGTSALTGGLIAAAGQDEPQAPERQAVQRNEPLPLVELVSAGGVGRLYTVDLAEARKAVQNGMKRAAGQVGYLPSAPFEGSAPMYRLKPSATASGWLFTASTAERDTLLGKGWVDEGVAAHLYPQAGPGLVPLLRFSNGKEWRLALESRKDELVNAGYKVDGRLGFTHSTWFRAGAVYFGMFNINGHQRIIQRTKEVYGREGDWWGGVRDFKNGTHYAKDNWPNEDFSYLEPSMGYYDDSNPATLEKHIDQATSAGLSFFNFYWYWDSKNGRPSVTGASLDAFFKARNTNNIDFTIGLCAHPFDGLKIPTSQFDAVADTLTGYLAKENTLRTNDGRKILNICDARGLGDGKPEQIKRFADTVRAKAKAAFGESIYVMINQAGFDPKQVPAAGGNAAYCTTDGPGVEGRSYQKYLDKQRDFFAAAPGAYSRCVMSDFDERPRYPIENADVKAIRWMPDASFDNFRKAVRNVRADATNSTRPPEVDNLVYVYAWNEWHEGGVVEPSKRDGCRFLDVLREELRLTKGAGCTS
ncbi:glycosyl transferase family WbsX [Herbihabitans rhizosphaerae]|uniref:Glycosyl transferase family WbsX n=1 Tax=Herbihabitans rhizosphaerae TaxID=1872711 RepID=A0A4Q7L7X9_9PSEU|nr:glycosyl transferase family WbsX [Herbihabitans rhizosphaerae]